MSKSKNINICPICNGNDEHCSNCDSIEARKEMLTIRESITGYYFYHIAKNNKPICGAENTMPTSLNLKSWGLKTHIGERYCKKCMKIIAGE